MMFSRTTAQIFFSTASIYNSHKSS